MLGSCNRSKLGPSALAAALLLSAAIPSASARVFSFGDSYSDNGNVSVISGGSQPGPDYWAGRFTNGWTVAERLTFRLTNESPGMAPGLNYIQYPNGTSATGGIDFAHAGSTAITRTNASKHLSVINQTKYFKDSWTARRVTVSSGDVATIWAGANDYLVYNVTNTSTVTANIVNTMVANVASTKLGTILVFNLHNLGDLPGYVDGSRRTSLNNLTASHNSLLASRLTAAQSKYTTRLILVDVNRAISLAHQGLAGGFTVVRSGQNGSFSGTCLGDGLPMWDCPSTYLYYDYAHFTWSGHEYLASIAHDRLNSVLAQARQTQMAAAGTGSAMAAQSQKLGSRFAALQEESLGAGAQRTAGGLGVFAFGMADEEPLDGDGLQLSDGGERRIGAGADVRWGDWVAGAAAIRSTPGDEERDDAAEFRFAQSSEGVSAYLGWISPETALTLSATHMRGDQETERATVIQGLALATGRTTFSASALEATGAVKQSWDGWSLKGEAGLRFDDVQVAAYQETGTLGLSDTAYDALDAHGLAARAGLTLAFEGETFTAAFGAHAISRLSGDAPLEAALPAAIPGLQTSRSVAGASTPLTLASQAAEATFSAGWRIDGRSSLTIEAAAIATPEGETAAGVSFGAKIAF